MHAGAWKAGQRGQTPRRVRVACWVALAAVFAALLWPHAQAPANARVIDGALFQPAPAAARVPAAQLPAAADLQDLRAAIAEAVRQGDNVGVAIAVVEDGKLRLSEGYGWADRELERPVRADTLFRVGSVSKSIIGLLALRAQTHGWLELDQPIRELGVDVEFDNAWAAELPLTLGHLLEHSSGFDELRFNEMIARDESEAQWPLAQVLGLNPRSRRARWRPGTRHAYSQVGFTVATRLIEARAGIEWRELVQREVLDPIGMRDASFAIDATVRDRLAAGYDGPARRRVRLWRLHHRPGGNLNVSARDLGHLIEMLVARGQVEQGRMWSGAQLDRFERGETLPVSDLAPTYGLGIYPQQYAGDLYYGHGGWLPGYQAWYGYSPTKRNGVVMLANETGPQTLAVWQVRQLLAQYLAHSGAAPTRAATPATQVSLAQLEPIAGAYRFDSPQVQLTASLQRLHQTRRLHVDEHGVWLQGEWGNENLEVVGPRALRRPGEVEPSLTFWADPRGNMHMYDADYGFASYQREAPSLHLLVALWFGLSQLALVLACFSALIWIPGRLMSARYRSVWTWPGIAAWAMVLTFLALQTARLDQLAVACPRTVFVFLVSWGFAVATARALWSCIRAWRGGCFGWLSRVGASVVTLVLCSWLWVLLRAGWIGLRTWAW